VHKGGTALAGEGEVLVRVPGPLRSLTQGQGEVRGRPGTLRSLIDELDAAYPGLKARLCEPDGSLRRFVNVFVDEEDVRFLKGLDTEVRAGARVSILPAVAGGA
jgi:molybdopterin synthase sulfur carrier subunit